MTKTRNISDLLDANGDVKSGALDNVPASNDASALTTGTLPDGRITGAYTGITNLTMTGDLVTGGDISTGNNGMVFILDSAGQKSGRIVTDSSSANALEIGADPDNSASGSYTAFRIDNSEKARIDDSGNVGIGTSSPGANLEISSGSYGSSNHHQQWSYNGTPFVSLYMDAYASPYFDTDSASAWNPGATMVWKRQGSEKMRIDSSGRVIIGGTTPDTSAKLTLEGGDLRFNTDDKGILWGNNEINGNNASDFINIVTAGAERMRITSSGSVLVGTTNILSASNTTDSGCMLTSSHGWITNNGASALRLQRLTSTGLIQTFYYSGTLVGDISVTGSSTSYNTSSDYRLKENVSYDFDATSRLKQLKPARFNFIADADTTVDGFIAHEVSSVVPEAISGEKDAVDEDGNPEYQGIDQAKLVPLLVKTIQELEARITTLEANNP